MAGEGCVVVDCDSCAVRGPACDDCVVSALLGGPPGEVGADEVAAFDVLAACGLVPPLRLVAPVEVVCGPPGTHGAGRRVGGESAAAS